MKTTRIILTLTAAATLSAIPAPALPSGDSSTSYARVILLPDSLAPDTAQAPKAKEPTKEEKARAKFIKKNQTELDSLAALKARVYRLRDSLQTLRADSTALASECERLRPIAAERQRRRAETDSLRAVFHRHIADSLRALQARRFGDIDTLRLSHMADALRLGAGHDAKTDSLAAKVQALADARRTFFAAKEAWEKDRNPLPLLQVFGPAQESERERLCRQEMLWRAARIKLRSFIHAIISNKAIRENRQKGWNRENTYILEDLFADEQARTAEAVGDFKDLKSDLTQFVKDLTSRVEPGDIEKRYTNDTNTSTP